MREEQALNHQAKAHREAMFQIINEEKDEKINVLQTQVGSTETTKPFSKGVHCPFGLLIQLIIVLCLKQDLHSIITP